MKKAEELEKYQHVAYQTFYNAFKNKKVSQAFLLSGKKGYPLLECAKFLAQSLICKESVLACEECDNCIRIYNDNYTDLIIIDGSLNTIKKNEIDTIQERFSKTAIEQAGKKVYILHCIENATLEAINGLLKFLEEPYDDVFAILTTENINKVLPTIISRCQLVRITNIPLKEQISNLLKEGIEDEDAKILTEFYSNKEDILKVVNEGNYHEIKDNFLDLMNAYLLDYEDLNYTYQTTLIKQLNTKENVKMFLQLFQLFVKDSININGDNYYFVNHLNLVKKFSEKIKDSNKVLTYILEANDNVNRNMNLSLLLDQLLFKISKEE